MTVWARNARAIDVKEKKLVDNMMSRVLYLSDLRTALKIKVFKDQGDEAVELLDRALRVLKKKNVIASDPDLIEAVEAFIVSIKEHRKGGLKAVK